MTLGGDIRTIVVNAGTALTQTYRAGHVPDDAALPYASFLDPVADVPALSGDARTLARRRTVQVDVWTDEGADADAIIDVLVDALDGAATTDGIRLRVVDVTLVPGPEAEEDIVHHAITVQTPRLR